MFRSFKTALPIMIGYLALGIPCGILGAKAGMSTLQVALLSALLYSGSGQYMIASMTLSGLSPVSIALPVALVNARQLLYASALLPFLGSAGRWRATLAAANITDESFGVNLARFAQGGWSAPLAFQTNCWSQFSWIVANTAGAFLGAYFDRIDTALAAFAMTSIFTCLLAMQALRLDYAIAALASVLTVALCKLTGFANEAIFLGAIAGVASGMATRRFAGSRTQEISHAVE
jgi:4-azaleucine resistance transporter AzlC